MKYIALYGGAVLIGVVTTALKFGYLLDGKWYWPGATVTFLATMVWVALINIITRKPE